MFSIGFHFRDKSVQYRTSTAKLKMLLEYDEGFVHNFVVFILQMFIFWRDPIFWMHADKTPVQNRWNFSIQRFSKLFWKTTLLMKKYFLFLSCQSEMNIECVILISCGKSSLRVISRQIFLKIYSMFLITTLHDLASATELLLRAERVSTHSNKSKIFEISMFSFASLMLQRQQP